VSVLINNRLNAIKKIKHAKTSAEARAMIESLKAKKVRDPSVCTDTDCNNSAYFN